jgi:hypothetical protein
VDKSETEEQQAALSYQHNTGTNWGVQYLLYGVLGPARSPAELHSAGKYSQKRVTIFAVAFTLCSLFHHKPTSAFRNLINVLTKNSAHPRYHRILITCFRIMTLFSLLRSDGPMLTIVNSRETIESTATWGWSDIPPFVSDELITTLPTKPNSDIDSKPLQRTATSLYTSQSSPDFSSPSILAYTSPIFDQFFPHQPSPISPIVSSSRPVQTPSFRRQQKKKNVSFSSFLEIREHSVTVGDHPCCEALPLSLAWEHATANKVPFDDFESVRAMHRRPSRELRLSYDERKNILRRIAGFSDEDLTQAHAESRQEFTLHHVPRSLYLGTL